MDTYFKHCGPDNNSRWGIFCILGASLSFLSCVMELLRNRLADKPLTGFRGGLDSAAEVVCSLVLTSGSKDAELLFWSLRDQVRCSPILGAIFAISCIVFSALLRGFFLSLDSLWTRSLHKNSSKAHEYQKWKIHHTNTRNAISLFFAHKTILF